MKQPTQYKTNAYTLKDMYKMYAEQVYPESPLSFTDYVNCFLEYIEKIMEGVIKQGNVFNLGFSLGNLYIYPVERTIDNLTKSNKAIDFKASNLKKKELIAQGKIPATNVIKINGRVVSSDGEDWLVFHTTDSYCKFFWDKNTRHLPQKYNFKLKMTRGIGSNKEKLAKFLGCKEDKNNLYFNKIEYDIRLSKHKNDTFKSL